MKKKWISESELAIRAVSKAAKLMEEKGTKYLTPRMKSSPRSIFTDLDVLIEKCITEVLKPSGYPIIGEETSKDKGADSKSRGPVWYVDPIDGTANIVSSIPFYAISVGLFFG
ncbi:MAG: hypothetical protein JW994_05175, partial [Candidatus Omnitrophica bacterium]|nr:hypothetical protein [Candidatus Omnitrophota bacterium]